MPGVSIILRTDGRRADLLDRALASLAAQDHPGLEAVVVQDGGDDLAARIARHRDRGLKVRYLPIPKSGRSVAANAGMEAATGDLAGLLDDDDELLPSHVRVLSDALMTARDAVAAYGAAWQVPTFNLSEGRVPPKELARSKIFHAPYSAARLLIGNIFPIQSVLLRRELWLRLGGFSPRYDALEDWEFWLRLAGHGSFLPVDRITSLYRVPAEADRISARVAVHAAAREKIMEAMTEQHWNVSLRDAEIGAADLLHNLDDHVGARWALKRLWRRIRLGR
jgi:glycosyltransferase involved in cell wall biosynthesis